VCRDLRASVDPPPACLMLTSFSDDEALFGAIMAGAAGYMLKQVSITHIVSAVRTVAAGGSLLDANLIADRAWDVREHGTRIVHLTEGGQGFDFLGCASRDWRLIM
jgi:DNA-binding NarL/FixJ family response regulator